MNFARVATIPKAHRVFLYGVVCLGLAATTYSSYRVIMVSSPPQWLIVAMLAAVAGSVTVRMPGVHSKVSLSESLIFTNILLFGPHAGALTAAVDGIMGSIRSRTVKRRMEFVLFNTSTMVLSALIAGEVFFRLMHRGPLFLDAPFGLFEIIPAVLALAAVDYVVNTGLVVGIISLESGEGFLDAWKKNFLWTAVSYFGGASVAIFLALKARDITPTLLAYLIPFILLTYFMYRSHQDKLVQNQHNQELDKLYLKTVEALAMAIDAKDHATQGHAARVFVLARGLAEAVGIDDPQELRAIEAAALLHDIGNLAVPDYILHKPGKLTESEFQKVKVHPVVGARILSTIPFPYPVAAYVRHHHENWDGTGYPDGLVGEQIPLGSRVLAVVDAYEALTCNRPYQPACDRNKAIATIRKLAGKKFDPHAVERFAENLDNLLTQADGPGPQKAADPAAGTAPASARQSRSVKDFQPFTDISRSQEEALAIYELARSLGNSLNLHDTLAVVGEELAKLIPFTTCAVYLWDETRSNLVVAHVAGRNADALRDYSVPAGERLSGWVAAHRRPALNSDPSVELAPIRSRLEIDLDNALVHPLCNGDDCLGVIALFGHGLPKFQDAQAHVLESVSNQAAAAIQNAVRFERSQEGALRDELTSLPNARYLETRFEGELRRAQQEALPLCVMMMDLDGFKPVNDTYGHNAGDLVMVEVARVLRAEMRDADVVVRWRGDEFVAMLPGTEMQEAQVIAQRIQSAVDSLRIEVGRDTYARVGISAGCASYPEDGSTPEALIRKADEEMYNDKSRRRAGKDPLSVAGSR